jgi:tRNA dimethylallyltransferase
VSKPPLFAIVGPTAAGKSDLGIALAREFDGEIINADSVQVYRGIYIATAKVPEDEQQGIPHHLIDIAAPTENYTAVAWSEDARSKIAEIEDRGRRAFLVGGSGFYLRALTVRLCKSPTIDPRLRPRLQEILRRRGPEHLHRMLFRVDPELATRYAAKDWSRVTRALEVYFSSRKPMSEWQAESPEEETSESHRLHYLVLNPPREVLYERINRRADKMAAEGLVEEVRSLIEAGVPADAKAFGAHGYRRVVEYLEGTRSLESAIEQMKLDTRHYAKRQLTWWRKQPRAQWLDGFGFEEATISKAREIVTGISQTTD